MGFLLRWLCAFILLTLTFNPTGYNFVHWSIASYTEQLPLTLFLGLCLTVGYIIYLRATLRSIGIVGILLVFALVGTLLWMLIDWGVLSLQSQSLLTWVGLLAMSLVLGIGLSWSHVRRHLSGQSDMDDVDE